MIILTLNSEKYLTEGIKSVENHHGTNFRFTP